MIFDAIMSPLKHKGPAIVVKHGGRDVGSEGVEDVVEEWKYKDDDDDDDDDDVFKLMMSHSWFSKSIYI